MEKNKNYTTTDGRPIYLQRMSFLGREKVILAEKYEDFADKFILEEALKMFGDGFISFELYATDMGFSTQYKTSLTKIKREIKPVWKTTIEEIQQNPKHPLYKIVTNERAKIYTIIQFHYRDPDGQEKVDAYPKKHLWGS